MSQTPQPSNENRLLAALPAAEYERLKPAMETVSLSLGQVLFRPDDEIQQVYFPTNSVISLLTDLEDGTGMEVGLVGPEGLAGISAFLGGSETKVATVQHQGAALRLRANKLLEEFRKGGALQNALLRYTHALMAEISQSVVCNARHKVDGRLARWILMFQDRVGSNEFELTQEFMANMLGVRRASVTTVANNLQARNLIRYQRGHFTILDREGLIAFTCECYPVVKEKFENFLL